MHASSFLHDEIYFASSVTESLFINMQTIGLFFADEKILNQP